jgi:iron complex transport system substrate-binding protein
MNKSIAHLLLFILALLVAVPVMAQEADEEVFPVTVEHKFGSTTITETPERVVSLGFNDQDPLLALGVTPIAVRYWYGDESDATFPWADEYVEGEEPIVFNMPFGGLNYEAILALEPDLIVAVYSGITEEEYDLLTEIAPTIAQTEEYTDFGMPWQAATLLIGEALGKSAEAEALVSEAETLIVEACEQNPQFAGKSIAVVYGYSAGSYGYYIDQDPRARFFTDLGFVVPEELLEIAGDSFYADVSNERLDLLDQDLIVFVGLQFIEGGQEAIEAEPLFGQLNAVQDGRIIYIANDFDDALQFSTVLSVPYVLDGVMPELEAVFPADGETAEASEGCASSLEATEEAIVTEEPAATEEPVGTEAATAEA